MKRITSVDQYEKGKYYITTPVEDRARPSIYRCEGFDGQDPIFVPPDMIGSFPQSRGRVVSRWSRADEEDYLLAFEVYEITKDQADAVLLVYQKS